MLATLALLALLDFGLLASERAATLPGRLGRGLLHAGVLAGIVALGAIAGQRTFHRRLRP